MKNIYQSIAAIMEEIGAVGKDKTNINQKYKFRGIDDVMNAIHPLLSKHKVFVVPQVLSQDREERQSSGGSTLLYSICHIKYTFYAEDGTFIEAITVGEGMDSGDKATNKSMAVAFKYALFQVFCIPTEEMKNDDPDNVTHEVAPQPQAAPKTISQAQLKRLYVIAKTKGYDADKVNAAVFKRYSLRTCDLDKTIYDEVVKGYESLPNKE